MRDWLVAATHALVMVACGGQGADRARTRDTVTTAQPVQSPRHQQERATRVDERCAHEQTLSLEDLGESENPRAGLWRRVGDDAAIVHEFLYYDGVVTFVPPTSGSGPCMHPGSGAIPHIVPCGPEAQCDGLARYAAVWDGNDLTVVGEGWGLKIASFVDDRFVYEHSGGMSRFRRLRPGDELTSTEARMLQRRPPPGD